MKLSLLVFSIATLTSTLAHGSEASGALQQPQTPPASKVSKSLFWVADTRKMDAFLNQFDAANLKAGAYAGEVLPDTRSAWRDYAIEATSLARRGYEADAAAKLAQMLKLAAVYRSFGGLDNVVQGEEIRYRAGVTAEKLGPTVTALIQSPYLEKDPSDCLLEIEAKAGGEKFRVTPSFWRHLEMVALESHERLSAGGTSIGTIASRRP